MLKKLKEKIINNDTLYVIAKCIKNAKNPEFIKLIRGYYTQPYKSLTLVLNSSLKVERETIYYIDLGVEDARFTGFCALLRHTLQALDFADNIGFLPFVKWGKGIAYYEKELDAETDNVFLYYFQPVSHIEQIEDRQFIRWKYADLTYCTQKNWELYRGTDDEKLKMSAEMFKKYIHLNQKTKEYIYNNIIKIVNNKKILGVHARGTDFNVGYLNHPKAVTSNMYIEKVREIFNGDKYDKIFVATEDVDLLNSFIDAFGDKLLYYDDVFRTSGKSRPHGIHNERPLHHYMLGLEVLRDIYTLAHCEGLVCGLSQVSFAARYVNLALDRKFNDVVIINNGINEHDSTSAKHEMKKFEKSVENLNHELHQNT